MRPMNDSATPRLVKSATPRLDHLALGNCFYMHQIKGYRYPKAYHRRLWELWVTQQGGKSFFLPDGVVKLRKHHAVLIPPGVPHHSRVEDEEGCLALDVHFRCDWAALREVSCRALNVSARALHHLRDFLDVWGDDEMSNVRRRATWALVLMELVQPSPDQPPEPLRIRSVGGALGDAVAERVIESMRADLAKGLRIEALTRVSGYSARRLRTLFRTQTGLTLREAFAKLRVDEAKRFLRHSPFQIRAIGQMVGFPNANKFSAFFRQRVGCTPREFAQGKLIQSREITMQWLSPIDGDEVFVTPDKG